MSLIVDTGAIIGGSTGMPIGRELASLLGVNEDASEAEVNARREALAEFYGSGNVPPSLSDWARQQALRLVEAESVPDAEGTPTTATTAASAATNQARANGRLFDRLLTSWIVLGSIVLAALIAGVVVARLDLLGVQPRETERVANALTPVPLDDRRINELSRIAEQNPTATEALRELGETYYIAGQWDRAIAWLTRLRAVAGDDVDALRKLGVASFNAGRPADAKSFWLAGLALAPDDPMLHYSLAHLYMSAVPADPEAARKEWQKVIEAAPNSTLATAAQSRLDAIPTTQVRQ